LYESGHEDSQLQSQEYVDNTFGDSHTTMSATIIEDSEVDAMSEGPTLCDMRDEIGSDAHEPRKETLNLEKLTENSEKTTERSRTSRDVSKLSMARALRAKGEAETACNKAEMRAQVSERRRFEAEQRRIEEGIAHSQAKRASVRREMELADEVEALQLELIH
ncbi:hypothetical protein V5O48_019563, partial [Marasmius crinis-equi]